MTTIINDSLSIDNKYCDIYQELNNLWNLNKIDLNLLDQFISLIDLGEIRLFSYEDNIFTLNKIVQKGLILYMKSIKDRNIIDDKYYNDPLPLKVISENIRVLKGAIIRYGSYISNGSIIMPSFINIGTFIGEKTMIDTWATVGSCAYIGANVHIAGGVGIGGVLEPVNSMPVIIEDNVFIGSRSIVVEGVHIKSGSKIGAQVCLTASTPIYDRVNNKWLEKGTIPNNAVVIPSTFPKEKDGITINMPSALIIKYIDSTYDKLNTNELLREWYK